MTSIKLILTGAQAWASVNGPLTSGMVGIPVTIEYDEAWDGLTKNLVCRCSPWGSNDGEVRTILNIGETSTVAHEVMQPDMYLYLGVEGFSSDGKLVIPTTWARCEKIEYGANTGEDPSTDSELSVWNQLLTEMEQLRQDVVTPELVAEIKGYAQSATQAASDAERSKDEAVAAAERAEADSLQNQDYSTLNNKPRINGVELDGDKTSEELGITGLTDEQAATAMENYFTANPDKLANVADGSITTDKLADEAVTAGKTAFITPEADNLIDMSKITKGYQGTSGVPAGGSLPNTTTGCTTDYIEVEPGKTYNGVGGMGTGNWWAASWYYDADKNPVAYIETNPFTVPDSVAFVRLTFSNNNDISTLQLGLYRGANPMVYTQGVQRYGLDALLTAAVKSILDANSVFKITDKNLYKLAADGSMDSTTGIFTLSGGSLNISDYIEITPGVWYISNCFAAPGYSAVYDADRNYISAFGDAIEWGQSVVYDGGTYKVFRVVDPDVRYIVNGSSKTLDTPITTPFIVRGNSMPDNLDGIDISTPDVAFVESAKKLLGITGNDLAGMTWAVLGDSITAASGLTRSYHSIIAEKLGLTAINYGYSGSRITYTDDDMAGTEMCTRYAEMTDDADIVTCFGGINDINNGLTLGTMGDTENTTFYGAMDILIRGLLYKYSGKRIGFITPLNYGSDSAEPYINAIFAVCRKYAVPVLDLYHEGMISTVTEELSTAYFKDGLHPSEAGHDVLARKVEAFLRRL